MNTGILAGELLISTGSSLAICTSVDASPLLTALITFGVSIVTMVGGELIKFLVAFLKKKREDLEKKDKDKETKKDE